MSNADDKIRINRAPVLTLWAAVMAERLGFDHNTALTLGQAVAGLSAYAKGVSLGIIEPKPDLVRERGEVSRPASKATRTTLPAIDAGQSMAKTLPAATAAGQSCWSGTTWDTLWLRGERS
jgi:hypothetical protein